MPAYPWGGYRNGYIPQSAMRQLRAEPGDYMRIDAADALDALATAFRARFSKGLSVSEAYRSYVTQKNYRDLYLAGRGNIAAIPGTSIHGWGLAVDLGSGVNRFKSPEHNWMLENAPKFGFDNDRGRADGEAWHWEYGNKTTWSADNFLPIDNVVVSEEVRAVQESLAYLGYKIVVDGIAGKNTTATVKQFQTDNNLTADGLVGPATQTTLDMLVDEKKNPKGIPMFDLFWDDQGTGYLGTPEGSSGLPSLQLFNLFQRRITAQRKGSTETFLRAEVDMMESILILISNSRLTGVKLDVNKLASAVNEELQKSGIPVEVKDISWDEAVDKSIADSVAAAVKAAEPRIVSALIRQSGEALSQVKPVA